MTRIHSKTARKPMLLPTDPHESARLAGLRYVQAEGPGIVRKRAGKGFSYIGPEGKIVCDRDEL